MPVLAPSWVGSRVDLLDVILHDKPADMVVQGGSLVNVHTREIYPADVAVKGGRIAAVGKVDQVIGEKTQVVDARGRYLTPGLIDAHLHSYHCYLGLTEFARAILLHGTTTFADGFYGQTIVSGMKATKFLLDEVRRTPLKIIFLVPLLAYSQNRIQGVSPSPQGLSLKEMTDMIAWPECFGLEEPQPFPVIEKEEAHVKMYDIALETGKVINGHAPDLLFSSAKQIAAYIAMGRPMDHETQTRQAALQKARWGMKILARQGSGWAPDVKELMKTLYEYHIDSRCFAFNADALPPDHLRDGDIDECIRVAVSSGVDPVTAVQMATLNAAEMFRVDHEVGSIAPGKIADILVVEDLQKFNASMVIANGQIVVKDGNFAADLKMPVYPRWIYETVQLKKPVKAEDFYVKADTGAKEVTVRAIHQPPGSISTPEKKVNLKVDKGVVQPNPQQDVIRIAMVDRHNKTGSVGNGFVHNLGLNRGAFGLTVNAVCENILIAGVDARDMSIVANELVRIGGGMMVVDAGNVAATVELGLFGLLSDEPLDRFLGKLDKLKAKLKELGWKHESPSVLEFLGACGDTPHMKITDVGLLDVGKRQIVDVVVT